MNICLRGLSGKIRKESGGRCGRLSLIWENGRVNSLPSMDSLSTPRIGGLKLRQIFGDRKLRRIHRCFDLFRHRLYQRILLRVPEMFRRQLMRQSRFLSKSLQQNRIQQPLAQKSLHTQTISSRHAPSIAPQFWRRWQSSDSDQKPPPDGPSQPEQQSEEDPLKKEVEVKTREIIDLKVYSLIRRKPGTNADFCS